MDEILVVHDEFVQADTGCYRSGGLYGGVQSIYDGSDNYPRSEDVDTNGMDIPATEPGAPVGGVRVPGDRSDTDVSDLRVLPGNYYAGYRGSDGKITARTKGYTRPFLPILRLAKKLSLSTLG